MSKDTYDFSDLDAILAEFRDGGADADTEPAAPEAAAPERVSAVSIREEAPQPEQEPAFGDATVTFELPALRSREELAEEKAKKKSRFQKAIPEDDGQHEPEPRKKPARIKKKAAPIPAAAEGEAAERREPETPVYEKRRIPGVLRFLLSILFLAFTLGMFGWALLYLHPASGALSFSGSDAKLRLSEKLDVYVNNATSDALGELTYIRKIYTLQESDTVAPVPDPAGFGMTYDPADIQDVLQRAAVLLDGQRVVFDPTSDFVPDEPIRYYLDDTILVITWKEYIEQRCCTFAEVKIAHGSQLRRKLVEDTYGSSVQLYASELANMSNAVVAANADFYAFRPIGVTVYQRKLYRFNPNVLDICFFNSSGDMIFTRSGELTTEEDTQRFVDDNDIVFSLAFGPILVDNGELQYCAGYPFGEVNEEYSRSCIAMTDNLHYLLMTINHTTDARPRATINELARIIYSKNVWKAYNLDGGQTAEIVMHGEPVNHIDWGAERVVSDIVYFATAIPEEVRS